jgi:hypothetical protein
MTLFWPGTTLEGVGEEVTEKDPGSVYVIVMEPVPEFPAASDAVIVIVLPPGCNGTEADHEIVPDASPEPPVALLVQVTRATPTLSDAVPLRFMVGLDVAYVGLEVGVEMVIIGFMVSALDTVTGKQDAAASHVSPQKLQGSPEQYIWMQ